ncbi:MAG TPA: transporter associated domain-containing protein [Pseudomonadales bacterium]|nr:transporter associated domain-containing protein [Pseudomonadales bacterium]
MSDDRPSSTFLDKITAFLTGEPRNRDDLIEVLTTAQQRGLIDADALGIIQGAFQVADMQVREIMVPRSQAVILKASSNPTDYLPAIIASQHSRFPVVGEDADNVLGILLAKDLLNLVANGQLEKTNIKELLRPATFVPESKRLNVLLKEFRSNRNHMAIVVNEYGGIAGIVTIEDVLEQIVGEIEDEHDWDDENFIKRYNGNEFIVKAITPVEDFNAHFNTKFSDDQFDTIGGILVNEFGHLPKRNETLQLENVKFRVLHADNRTIKLLHVMVEPA